MYKLVLIGLFLIGCGGAPQFSAPPAPSAVAGAGAGLVAGKVAEEIKEKFTPYVPLDIHPIEICSYDTGSNILSDDVEIGVTCIVVPCSDKLAARKNDVSHCVRKYASFDDFRHHNPKVITLRSGAEQRSDVLRWCKRNADKCRKYAGKYQGSVIVLTEEE